MTAVVQGEVIGASLKQVCEVRNWENSHSGTLEQQEGGEAKEPTRKRKLNEDEVYRQVSGSRDSHDAVDYPFHEDGKLVPGASKSALEHCLRDEENILENASDRDERAMRASRALQHSWPTPMPRGGKMTTNMLDHRPEQISTRPYGHPGTLKPNRYGFNSHTHFDDSRQIMAYVHGLAAQKKVRGNDFLRFTSVMCTFEEMVAKKERTLKDEERFQGERSGCSRSERARCRILELEDEDDTPCAACGRKDWQSGKNDIYICDGPCHEAYHYKCMPNDKEKQRVKASLEDQEWFCWKCVKPGTEPSPEGVPEEEEDMPCAACGDREWETSNEIFICDGPCGKAFHRLCLPSKKERRRVRESREDEEWFCRRCKRRADNRADKRIAKCKRWADKRLHAGKVIFRFVRWAMLLSPAVATHMSIRAAHHHKRRRLNQCIRINDQLLMYLRRTRGPGDIEVAQVMNNLACAYAQKGEVATCGVAIALLHGAMITEYSYCGKESPARQRFQDTIQDNADACMEMRSKLIGIESEWEGHEIVFELPHGSIFRGAM